MPNYTRKTASCDVEGCQSGGYMTRGLCKMHYARTRRHGHPGGPEKLHAVSWEGAQCFADDCTTRPKSRGLCTLHLKRQQRTGDPNLRTLPIDADALFRERHEVSLGGCWDWLGTVMNQGYGVFRYAGRSVMAHRFAYERHVGPIPKGLVIDHLCRNRLCVNPDHLEAVTNLENLSRGIGYRLENGMESACRNGHEYTPQNTYTDPRGKRRCRVCARSSRRKTETITKENSQQWPI